MAETAVLHPGAMGVSIGAALVAAGHGVRWCAAGRGPATAERAADQPFERYDRLEEMLDGLDVAVSVCPPHAAVDQARAVASAGYRGTYVDANAVAPDTARTIGDIVTAAGATYVDGGIVGPPAWRPDTTRLYLSGDGAPSVRDLFEGSRVEAVAIDGGIGAASALKMCFAASTKAVSAVVIGAAATARAFGVLEDLRAEWARRTPDTGQRLDAAAAGSAPKAWRFSGEMAEIGATFSAAGVPAGALTAAEELYDRLAPFKDGALDAETEAVLWAVLRADGHRR